MMDRFLHLFVFINMKSPSTKSPFLSAFVARGEPSEEMNFLRFHLPRVLCAPWGAMSIIASSMQMAF